MLMRGLWPAKNAKDTKGFLHREALFFFVTFAFFAGISSAAEMFPFVLPWDDATPSITNISSWLEKPAGRDGFVSVKDGHLFANGKRFRIFGVNMAFGANFPTHADAEKVAARMAKFGINCVRFHHMDMQAAPGGIWARDMRTLDPGQLDKLDYFIAELKKNGIYSDLNLHVSRTYPDRPKSEKMGNEDYDKGVDNFCAAMIALQKDYARALLTHVNAYTKNAYIAEPAVALIEINNENALLTSWHYGSLDTIAQEYSENELSLLWTKWLREKYGSDEKLEAAWKKGAREEGAEMIAGPPRRAPWSFEQHGAAKAHGETKGDTITFIVEQAGAESWHAQFFTSGLKIVAGEKYTATFRARAPKAMSASVNLMQAHEPWKVFASGAIALTPESNLVSVTLAPSVAEENARLGITGLGLTPGAFEFTDFSLRTARIDGSVPRMVSQKIPPFHREDYATRTEAAQKDWYQFLWQTEEKYWTGMYAFIREELKARSLIVGTQLGWSPFPIQQHMDVIDSHAYWQHPHFSGGMWNPDHWTVKNIPMAGREDGGTLPGLALQRVAGKPYICTEYSHPAPNEFAAEGFPLLCAYAALQDWDGIFAFAYSHRTDDWDKRYFPSFFDIDQHPVKMATLPASLAMFMRGDVRAAHNENFVTLSLRDGMEKARVSGPGIQADSFGVSRKSPFSRRAGFMPTDQVRVVSGPQMPAAPDPTEFLWMDRRAVISQARSTAIIGAIENVFVKMIEPIGPPGRERFGIVQLTVMDGDDFKSARRILITATGKAANTDMKWTSDAHESVGRNWGRAPSLVEGIAAKITLPVSDKKMKAWALDERGHRRDEVPMKEGIIEIGPQYRTLWYEVATE